MLGQTWNQTGLSIAVIRVLAFRPEPMTDRSIGATINNNVD